MLVPPPMHWSDVGSQPQTPRIFVQRLGGFQRRNVNAAFERRDYAPPRRTLLDEFVERDEGYWANRIDLKIDVPFTDHSHIIGRQGKNTQQVMKTTQCHIHFPDSNKNRDNEKSNQVTIAGALQSVETARRAVRGLAPLAIQFNLHSLQPHVNVQSLIATPALDDKLGYPGLSVVVRINRASNAPYCLVRGAVNDEKKIVECIEYIRRLYFLVDADISYQISMEVMAGQQNELRGIDGCLLQMVSELTRAIIRSPHHEETMRGATTFLLQGPLASVLDARRYLIALLPCHLTFNIRGDQHPRDIDVATVERAFDVSLHLQQRNGQDEAMSCTITAPEYRIGQLYALRQQLCGLSDELPQARDYAFVTTEMHEEFARMQRDMRQRIAMTTIAPGLMPRAYIPPHQRMQMMPPPMEPMTPFMYPTPHTPIMQQAFYTPIHTLGPPITLMNGVQMAMQPQPGMSAINRRGLSPSVSSDSGRDTAKSNDAAAMQLLKPSDAGGSTGGGSPASPTTQATADAAIHLLEASQNGTPFHKAPGYERLIDYDTKRVLAAIAQAQNPTGLRAPNDAFTGCGFSQSVPHQMMTDRLRAVRLNETTQLPKSPAPTEDKVSPTPPPSTPTNTKPAMPMPTSAMRSSHVIKAVVPEHSEVHHTRTESQSNSPPNVTEPSTSSINRFTQSSAMETMRPLLYTMGAHAEWQLAAAAMPLDDPTQYLTLRGALAEVGLEKLYAKFEENEVDLEALLWMNESDFETIGASLGARAKLRALQHRLNTLRQWSQTQTVGK